MPAKTFTDQRVLNILDFVVKNNIKKVKTEGEFLKSIGYDNINNVALVRKGTQSFRIEHLVKLCAVYGIDANYLLSKHHLPMTANNKKTDAITYLKQAVRMIEETYRK